MLTRWRLVSLHASLHTVFRNLIALVITNDKTTWGYRELLLSRKLEHRPRNFSKAEIWARLVNGASRACCRHSERREKLGDES